MPEEPTVRPAARLIIIDQGDRVLLMCSAHAPDPPNGHVWFTPGGGLDPGESYEEAAARELREETGILAPVGPCVWVRRHVLRFHEKLIDHREHFYVVRTEDPTLNFDGWTDDERMDIGEVRWWSQEEIAGSGETFAPRNLAGLLPAVLRGEYPAQPIVTGV